MRKLLVFQHVPYEPLGTLDGQFREAGFRIRYMNFHRQPEMRAEMGRYHGLVVLGGPMSADETDRYPHLAGEQDAIRQAIDIGLPVLGICLGAQLIASSLGGQILRGAAREMGWFEVRPTSGGGDDPLVSHFRRSETIFQWHSDTFTLPDGAIRLASSKICENQAFRFSDHVYGLQFHLEVDEPLIQRWLRNAEYRGELTAPADAGPEQIREQTIRHIHRAHALSRNVFGEFIERFYRWRRRRALPSR
jgi:GMP synthase (glutamine-hydrolysing)